MFQLNAQTYPESANCYDSLGESLAAVGRIDEAITNYEKSLELDSGNKNAVEQISKLQATVPVDSR